MVVVFSSSPRTLDNMLHKVLRNPFPVAGIEAHFGFKISIPPLPNSKLVWDYDPAQVASVNFTVWESQDLRTWRVIGTVTAPVGTATATEFDLGFSVFQTTKPYAFWRVSVAWKV